jgi:hypothetical protein
MLTRRQKYGERELTDDRRIALAFGQICAKKAPPQNLLWRDNSFWRVGYAQDFS